VAVISQLAGRPEFAETPDSLDQIDRMALQARIRSALRADDRTHEVKVSIESRAGHVTLSGIVFSDDERELTQTVVAAVEGVIDIDNQLRVARSSSRFTYSKT
jgi:osmotically-inducible protein OsmY